MYVIFAADAVKKRWKSLRDVFRSELKKIPKPKSGDSTPSSFTSSWCHFESLLFLRDQMMPRQLKGNLSSVEVVEEVSQALTEASDITETRSENDWFSQIDNMESQEDTPITHENEIQAQSNASSDHDTGTPDIVEVEAQHSKHTIQRRNAKRKQDNDIDRFLSLEQEKIKLLKSDNSLHKDDEDYHFLMSFYPPLKRMRVDTKMWFRLKMQELLYNCTVNETPQQQGIINTATSTPLCSPSTSSNYSLYQQL